MSSERYEIFQHACKVGDLETVKKYFDEFNVRYELLCMRFFVVMNGHLNVLKYIYQHGVDLQSFFGIYNPLTLAAEKGWVDITDFLLEIGVDINLQNSDGWTALMYASWRGQTDVVDRLLSTRQCNVNLKDKKGFTALFLAVENGHLEIVDRLIVYGANYYHVNNNGENLLHYAIGSGNIDMVQKLLPLEIDINQQDNNGWTPLTSAMRSEDDEIKNIFL